MSPMQDVRLYAAILAKNVVGAFQRKFLGTEWTREWTHLDQKERQEIKEMAVQLLMEDHGDQVNMQARSSPTSPK